MGLHLKQRCLSFAMNILASFSEVEDNLNAVHATLGMELVGEAKGKFARTSSVQKLLNHHFHVRQYIDKTQDLCYVPPYALNPSFYPNKSFHLLTRMWSSLC